MSYVNADGVLPQSLIMEIQKYVDGQVLYIPRKNESSLSWGEKNGTRDKMAKRNQTIVSRFHAGEAISSLSEEYCLSGKRIQGIIREYGSSKTRTNGGFTNE